MCPFLSKYHIVGNHMSRLIWYKVRHSDQSVFLHIMIYTDLERLHLYVRIVPVCIICSLMELHLLASNSCTVNPVISGHSYIDKTKVLKTNGSLIKAGCIVECSPWNILQYF